MPIEVPDTWEVRRLDEVAELRLSNVDKKSILGDPPVRLCNYMDVYRNQTITSDVEFMPATATKAQIGKFRLQAGDVMITKDSEDPSDIAVPSVVVEDLDPPVLCGYHLALLRPRATAEGPYLAWALRSHAVNTQFTRRANGTTRFGLTSSVIGSTAIPLPPLPEQKKIAAILSSVDDAIAATQKVIEQTEQVKTGLLQTLMTRGIGHTRFKTTEIGEIPEGWEVSKVGTEFKTQLGKMLSKAARSGPNQVPYLANAQVQWDRVVLVDLSTMHFTSAELAKFSLEPGDLLVCEGGEIGRTAIWEGADFTVSYQKAIHRLRSRGRILPRFLLRYMRLAREDGRLTEYTSRTSIAHLTQEQLRRVRVPVPPIDEQHAITSQFEGVDAVLRRNGTTLPHLQTLKRGLLQDLLTGRVRVTPD